MYVGIMQISVSIQILVTNSSSPLCTRIQQSLMMAENGSFFAKNNLYLWQTRNFAESLSNFASDDSMQ
jgi:hypothetical protein